MTSKFEQLIEYVINDEEAKAKELFHDIVVEKSREIYENLMNEEEMDEECSSCHKAPCVCESEEELDESEEEDSEEELDDSEEELMNDVEAEEQGMQENEEEFDNEAEEDGEDLTHDLEDEHNGEDLEDRVVDLEDKLDELMAEFESLMSGEEHSDSDAVSDMDGGDALEMDDTETSEFDEMRMMENVKLDAAPKPVTGEESFVNTKATYAVDSGKAGMAASPVKMTGDVAQGRPAPKTGDLPDAGKFKNVPGKGVSNAKLDSAPKPVTAQASGVNTKTPFPKG